MKVLQTDADKVLDKSKVAVISNAIENVLMIKCKEFWKYAVNSFNKVYLDDYENKNKELGINAYSSFTYNSKDERDQAVKVMNMVSVVETEGIVAYPADKITATDNKKLDQNCQVFSSLSYGGFLKEEALECINQANLDEEKEDV